MTVSVQARLTGPGRTPDVVDGPDDADVVVSVGRGDVALEPAVAFMQGRLKATGHTGKLFEALASGAVREALDRAAAAAG